MASNNHNIPRRSRTQIIMKHHDKLKSKNNEESTNEIAPQNNLPKNSNDSFNGDVAASSPRNHQTLNQERRNKEEIQTRDEGEILKRNKEEIQGRDKEEIQERTKREIQEKGEKEILERDREEIQERDEEEIQKRDERVNWRSQNYSHSNNLRGNDRSFHQKKFSFSRDSTYYSNSNYYKRGASYYSSQNNSILDENKRDEGTAKEVELPSCSRNNNNESSNRNIPCVSWRSRETLDQERKDEKEAVTSENSNDNNHIHPIGYEKKSFMRNTSNSQFLNMKRYIRLQNVSASSSSRNYNKMSLREESGRRAARQDRRAPDFSHTYNSNYRTNRRSLESEERNINEVRLQKSLHHDNNRYTKYERNNNNNSYQKEGNRGPARNASWSQRSHIKKDMKGPVQKENDEGAASIAPKSTSAFHNDENSLPLKEDIKNHVHEEIDEGATSTVSELTSAFHNDEISLPPKEDIKNHVYEEIDEGVTKIVPELLSLLSIDEIPLLPNEDTKHRVQKGKGKGAASIDPELLSFLYNDEISFPSYEDIKDHLPKEKDEGAISIVPELQSVSHNDEIPPPHNEDIEQHAQKKSSHEGVANVVPKSQKHQPEDDEINTTPQTIDYILLSSKDELAHTEKEPVVNGLTGMRNTLGLRELWTIFSKYCKLRGLIIFIIYLIFFFTWHYYNLIVLWRITI